MFTNEQSVDLLLQARVKKTIHGVKTHWLSSKGRVLATVANKEGNADKSLGHERTQY